MQQACDGPVHGTGAVLHKGVRRQGARSRERRLASGSMQASSGYVAAGIDEGRCRAVRIFATGFRVSRGDGAMQATASLHAG